ncbi:MAG: LON peptidase substrate-binding domain-containing protein [Chthoniobacterales bacterium]
MTDFLELPDAVPVMPLPGALLFPHALLPLYIFEPRYRAMLKHVLDHHRMFCVALIDSQRAEWRSVHDFSRVTAVGLIRACVGRPDGSSNLILQGLRRVRFTSFPQEEPFPIARIEPLVSVTADAAEAEALGTRVLEFYTRFKRKGRHLPAQVDAYLSQLRDPEMLADLMAATFISDASRRQRLLEELSVAQRLRLLIEYLRDEIGNTSV